MSSPDELRTSSFYPVIDRLVNEMTRRFSTEAGAVLMGTSALNPKNTTFLEKESLEPMAQLYEIKRTICWPRCTKCDGSQKEKRTW
ncbi:Uncharacterized protein FKW44_006713 [Caligus rogercresseyi]|uniref:Uncharacterized protein n=1 Tax=Caligus rogercresseyi TaxID=217165 RepID=A0A7T8KDR4_CALRO|nr:Uncharacterized protein FKW44_006713 [Caligus rogercresseyi]